MPAQRDSQANGRGAGRGGGARLRLRDALALTGSLLALRLLRATLPTASRHGAQFRGAGRVMPWRLHCNTWHLFLCCKQSAYANTDVQGCTVLRLSSHRPRIGRVRWPLRALETRYWQRGS